MKREVVAATLETSHGTPVATVLFLETATTTGTDSAAEAHQSFGSSPWLEDCSLGSASAVGLSSWQTSVVETQSLPRHDLKSSLAVVLLRVEQGCQNRREELCGEAHNTSLELWPGMADVGTGQGHCCMCCSAAEAGLRTVPAASLDVACMAPGTGNHLRSGNGAPCGLHRDVLQSSCPVRCNLGTGCLDWSCPTSSAPASRRRCHPHLQSPASAPMLCRQLAFAVPAAGYGKAPERLGPSGDTHLQYKFIPGCTKNVGVPRL